VKLTITDWFGSADRLEAQTMVLADRGCDADRISALVNEQGG
jgi:hypothetical protein